jgi:hypothetical protein
MDNTVTFYIAQDLLWLEARERGISLAFRTSRLTRTRSVEVFP